MIFISRHPNVALNLDLIGDFRRAVYLNPSTNESLILGNTDFDGSYQGSNLSYVYRTLPRRESMNKQLLRFTPFLLMCLVFPLAATAQVVSIPDANLRTAIENALGKPVGVSITVDEMAQLTHLEAPNANISDLTGLEHATNLTGLWLGDKEVEGKGWINSNSIKDLSPLGKLTDLTWLNLSQNNITDLSPLAELTNLTWLDIGGNNLSNISPISGLTNLTALRLWRNNISDISPVTGLIHLTELNFHSNNISDISPIVANTGLGNGDEIYVQGNPLSYQSIYTYISILQSRGVTVEFDNRTPATLLTISGVITELDNLLIVGSER